MKKYISTILLLIVLLAGVGLLVYPSFSNWWNNNKATHVIADYNKAVTKADHSAIDEMWKDAQTYNESLNGKKQLNDDEMARYNQCLNATGVGIMGYVEIPSIKVSLPIYHGTEETVLQVGIGHIEWSSLPTGDIGTHVVISGHRGLPSARLFTDIDQLIEGDLFFLEVLDKEFAYEVDRIQIVLPYELSGIQIDRDKEYCTLVTCTPYGVNSHRLLVRGHRVDYKNSDVRVTADAMQIDTMIVAPFVAAPILIVLFILMLTRTGKKKQKR